MLEDISTANSHWTLDKAFDQLLESKNDGNFAKSHEVNQYISFYRRYIEKQTKNINYITSFLQT